MTAGTLIVGLLAAGGPIEGTTAGTVVILFLAAGSLAWVIAPLLQKDAAVAERIASKVSAEMDLHSRHDMVLAALKDVEEDRATDKLDDADYHDLKNKLTTRAVELMKQMDELDEEHRRKEAQRAPRAIPHPNARP